MKTMVKVLCTALCLISLLSGCGSSKADEEAYAGTYLGQSGSTLILYDDNTCKYTQTGYPGYSSGDWKIEDDQLIVSDVGVLAYDIYADLNGDDTSLLFEAHDSRWHDELFVRVS